MQVPENIWRQATAWPEQSRPRQLQRRAFRNLVVCKFGGTSLGDLERVRGVSERLHAMQRQGRRVVAVLSAMGHSTDQLVTLGHRISPAPPARELDALMSLGESLSCSVAALTIDALGGRAISLSGAQAGVLTDGAHGHARLVEIRPQRILDALDQDYIVLVTGFQGVSPDGDVTTLGRGGSDTSAVVLAASLGVSECEIFTDVPGVFTADPRLVPAARQLVAVDYEEMQLLAAAGAAVLQPRSVELALTHDIKIHVRCSFSDAPGTWIRKEPVQEHPRVIGVAHRSHERLYAARDLSAVSISTALGQRGITLGTLVRRADEECFTAPDAAEEEVAAALHAVGASHFRGEDLGSVSVVGAGIGSRPNVVARALAVLESLGVGPLLFTNTPSRITCHLSSDRVGDAVRALHEAFELHRVDETAVAA